MVAFAAAGRGAVSVFTANDPRVIYAGNPSRKNVSLLINVYEGGEHIAPMLDALRAGVACATFFIGGVWAQDNHEILKAIADAGHELGNHGYFQKDHKKLSAERNREEIHVTERMIESVTGITTNLFAPPAGSCGKTMVNICDAMGYKIVLFSKDTGDLRDRDASVITTRAVSGLRGGEFILMHPTAQTAKALPDIIKSIKAQGYGIVTVSECLV